MLSLLFPFSPSLFKVCIDQAGNGIGGLAQHIVADLGQFELSCDCDPAFDRRQDCDRDGMVLNENREWRGGRVRFKSRPCQVEIGDALLELDADCASFAVAFVVGFMYEIRRGERLESKEQNGTCGGEKPSRILARAPEIAETEHFGWYCRRFPLRAADILSYLGLDCPAPKRRRQGEGCNEILLRKGYKPY